MAHKDLHYPLDKLTKLPEFTWSMETQVMEPTHLLVCMKPTQAGQL